MARYHCVLEKLPYSPPEQLDEAASIDLTITQHVR